MTTPLLNVIVGAALALAATFLMDLRSDRRRLKRRRQLLYLKIGRLMAAWHALDRMFEDAVILWERNDLQAISDAPEIKSVIAELIHGIGHAAEDQPDFEDLIASDDDRLVAHRVLYAFGRSKALFEDERNVVLKADIVRREKRCAAILRDLNDAYRHFGGKK